MVDLKENLAIFLKGATLLLLFTMIVRIVVYGTTYELVLEPIWIWEVLIITLLIAIFLLYFYVIMIPKKELEIMFENLNILFKERDRVQEVYSRSHDDEAFNRLEAELKTDQKNIRSVIIEEMKDKPYLKSFRNSKVMERAEKDIKTAKSFYSEQELPRRLWLYGIAEDEAKEIFNETKRKYCELAKEWKKEGLSRKKIKNKLMEENGFMEHRASVIMKQAKTR